MQYDKFAKYYDELMYDCDYFEWSQYLLNLIKKESTGKKLIDIACGSGKHTILLKKAGYDVIGMDNSATMLEKAIINSRKEMQNIMYIKQDIIEFDIENRFDIATCICDGINYVSDLKTAFKNIFNSLKNDGVFLFDISSEYKLKNILGDNLFTDETENVTYIWQNSFDEKTNTVEMYLTFFVKNEDGLYERFDETHIQYAHKFDEVKTSLISAGFKSVKAYAFLSDKEYNGENVERIQFIAKKEA